MVDSDRGERLFDEDCLYFLGKTIPQLFIVNLEGVCSNCGKMISSDSCIMNCGCKYCKPCIEEKIKIATDGKILLNNFEKGKLVFIF